MGGLGEYVWVTSVGRADHLDKAMILGRSLRRVRSAFKTVAICSPSVPAADKLVTEFDLVVNLHPVDDNKGMMTMMSPEEVERQLKVHGWSLALFEKAIYLAPTCTVVKNCDDLFDKLGVVESSSPWSSQPQPLNDDDDDLLSWKAYLFHPNVRMYKEAKTGLEEKRLLPTWELVNSVAPLGRDTIVNVVLGRKDGRRQTGAAAATASLAGSIVNFVEEHPANLWRNGVDGDMGQIAEGVGPIEKMAIDICWSILVENEEAATAVVVSAFPPPRAEPVAVVGMGFRLPGASTRAEFWNLLIEGREAVGPVPPQRWTREQTRHYWKDCSGVEAGFLDCPIDEFDAKFFGISPKEAAGLDPQQRLLLEVSWEALEDAGIDPLSLHGTRTGIFVGSWNYDYKEHSLAAPDFEFFRSYMGNSIAAQSARLAHFLGTSGPSISTESACSSSIVAVDLAVHCLRRREAGLALASGVNLILNPFTHKLMEGVFSPDYRCHTFDASANGFARAEGAATLVLKRLSDAVRDGDHIWGLISGTGVAQEGISKSLGTPTVQTEAEAMRLALRDAGLDGGDEVDYVEAHGTGTQVGDPMEIAAIAKAYSSSSSPSSSERAQPLLIGSVKTNIGHTESVSGLAGIIKVLLALNHGLIPPHRNLLNLNPEINLAAIPAEIPAAPVPWPRNPNRKRMAGVSSFGITGTDGHVILEEPPQIPDATTPFGWDNNQDKDRPLHILKLSAKSKRSLELMAAQYEALMENPGEHKFADICYSANGGRATFPHRAVLLAKDCGEAGRLLKSRSFPTTGDVVVHGSAPICFLFTGQGSQHPGMASQLYSSSPLFRLHFDHVAGILRDSYNISIKDVMWGTSTSAEAEKMLSSTLYSQTSIFCVEYALLKLWEGWGVSPDYVVGHSLGEFAAAVAAGILEVEDALKLVALRSQLIHDEVPQGKMLVVRGDKEEVVDGMVAKFQSSTNPDFWVDIAALNSPEQTVLAGDSEMVGDFAEFCTGAGLKVLTLASSHAFHSRHMDPILESYGAVVSSTITKHPSTWAAAAAEGKKKRKNWPKYISGVDGRLIEDPTSHFGVDYWLRHTRDRVNFADAIKTAASEGVTLFLIQIPELIQSCTSTVEQVRRMGRFGSFWWTGREPPLPP